MKKFVALLVAVAIILPTLTSCSMFFPENTPDVGESEKIAHHEKYVFNDIKPSDSYQYEAYPYESSKSKPLIMGGQYYHGGFSIGYTSLPYTPGYATFDVSGLSGKTLSFVMGALEEGMNFDTRYAIVQIKTDGKTVVDTSVWTSKAPVRYTLDLTGVKELTFAIIDDHEGGYIHVGVAEMTVWDGEPTKTGPSIPESTKKLQLVKDILPFSLSDGVKIHSERTVTETQKSGGYNYTETRAYHSIVNESITVSGNKRTEALSADSSIAIAGESKEFYCFSLENRFEYISFEVGCENVENASEGSSWLVIYADGERLIEHLVSSDRIPSTITLNIKNCSTLKFEIIYDDGGDHNVALYNAFIGKTEADAAGVTNDDKLDALPDVCKLISNIPPFSVASNAEFPVMDGSTSLRTFSMAGRKYSEGVMLLSKASWLSGNTGAHVCFDLGGKFKYLTFTAGLMDKTPTAHDDKLEIYLDGVLTQTIELHAMDLPKEYIIDLKNCQEIKLELVGNESMMRPAYGIADMIVYKNEVVENDLFPEEEIDYPSEMLLLENIKPYLYNYGPGDMGDEDYYFVYDGSLQRGFKVRHEERDENGGIIFNENGEPTVLYEEMHHEGFALKTSVHQDLYGSGAQGAFAMAAIVSTLSGALMMLANDTVFESSFAAFDVRGEFKTVTFTVACIERQELWNTPQTEVLQIGSNDTLFEEIELSSRMEPTTYTINIQNTEQLVFWLDCDPDTAQLGGSSIYAVYDVVVNE